MQPPVQVTFRGTSPSPALESFVLDRAHKLEKFYDRIVNCRVTVEAPPRHHQKGGLFSVRVTVTVPGGELVATCGDHDHAHEDPQIAVRDAFDAITRRLEDHVRKNREVATARPTKVAQRL